MDHQCLGPAQPCQTFQTTPDLLVLPTNPSRCRTPVTRLRPILEFRYRYLYINLFRVPRYSNHALHCIDLRVCHIHPPSRAAAHTLPDPLYSVRIVPDYFETEIALPESGRCWLSSTDPGR